MSHCKANPCCSDPFFCEVPLPQDKTGLYHLNDKNWKKKSKEADSKISGYQFDEPGTFNTNRKATW